MQFSTADGDDIRVFITAGEVDNDPDREIEFEEVTVSVHKNEIEGRIRSRTNEEKIEELARSDRPALIEIEPLGDVGARTIEARVENRSGELEITGVQS